MLHELHIAGLGVIEDLDLPLHPGLNVLTGETGAGKTMVTVGLALALGTRASSSLVREGASAARVQARFDIPAAGAGPDVSEWADDGELILARTVQARGKGTARISGQLATASALASLGEHLVEVHGQHQAQRLLEPATQTAFLDRFAGDAHVVAVAAYREAFERHRELARAAAALREAGRDRERELDLLTHQVREIEAVDPQPGETERLRGEETRWGHTERLAELAVAVVSSLDGDEDDQDAGAVAATAVAAGALDDAASLDPETAGLAGRAAALAAELTELVRDVRAYREGLQADPGRLQVIRERLGALGALRRKYGETDDDVRAFLASASARLLELTSADDRLDLLMGEEIEAQAEAAERSAAVSAGRTRAAGPLGAAVEAELRELGMPAAVVGVELRPVDPPGPAGAERAELTLAADPGRAPAPLASVASGGELSRSMLACRSVLADLDRVPTIVFDEVDAGIGGQAGLAVGRRLARLARDRQVIVVTHLPQIAAFADRHVLVTKDGGTARLGVLDRGGRVAELSRMLAGMAGSAGARSHAEELLAEAEATGDERAPSAALP